MYQVLICKKAHCHRFLFIPVYKKVQIEVISLYYSLSRQDLNSKDRRHQTTSTYHLNLTPLAFCRSIYIFGGSS